MNLELSHDQFRDLIARRYANYWRNRNAFACVECPMVGDLKFVFSFQEGDHVYPLFSTKDLEWGKSVFHQEKYWRKIYNGRVFYTHRFNGNQVILFEHEKQRYHFFVRRGTYPEPYSYEPIVVTKDFAHGIEVSEPVWNPPPPAAININQRVFALDHIESMVWSLVNRKHFRSITKADFAYIYYNVSGWHAFYPSVEDLIAHHEAKEAQHPEYLNYLKCKEFALLRNEWDSDPNIPLPQQQQPASKG